MRFLWLPMVVVVARRGEHGLEVADWTRHVGRDDSSSLRAKLAKMEKPRTISQEDFLAKAKAAAATFQKKGVSEESSSEILKRAKAALAELVNYYGGDEDLLKKATRGLSPAASRLGARLARKIVSGDPIVIAAMGSSVTAGHDGFFETAWPAVLERRLKKVQNSVVVHNLAVGGRQPYPVAFCLESVAGKVDAVFREWEYWSFDEGSAPFRLDAGRTFGPLQAAEHFARRAADLADDKDGFAGFVQLDIAGSAKRGEAKTNFLLNSNLLKDEEVGVGVFSAFGNAFDHLRAQGSEDRVDRQGKGKCSGPNVGECPLSPFPDGHHSRAEVEGIKELGNRKAKLMVNWHPGSLGHEVVGNQLAYFILTKMIEALETKHISNVLKTRVVRSPSRTELKFPLLSSKARCAIATRPAVLGFSVGDLVDNATLATQWTDEPTPSAERNQLGCKRLCSGSEESCYDHLRKCSYHDQKRGFRGTLDQGPLTLKIPFKPTDSCVSYLVEPGHEWSKPTQIANWAADVSILIDDEPCHEGACVVSQGRGDYIQSTRIDVGFQRWLRSPQGIADQQLTSSRGTRPLHELKAAYHHSGDNQPCAPASVTITLNPVKSLQAWQNETNTAVCAVARNGRCEPHGIWRRYDFKCRKDNIVVPNNRLGVCTAMASNRQPNKVAAYIDSVIFF